MARYNPLNEFPHPNRVIVYSNTYETHSRAKRGTYKEAKLNDTLMLHKELLPGANTPARLVKKEIDYHRAGFPSGQLWQKLVGMFKKQLKLNLPLNVDALLLTDISKAYPLSALLKQGYKSEITVAESGVHVNLEKMYPRFRRQSIDGYQVEVAVMYFDFKQMKSRSDAAVSSIVPLNHPDVLSFEFQKGERGERYMISLKLTGSYKGEVESGHNIMAMQIIQTGIIS